MAASATVSRDLADTRRPRSIVSPVVFDSENKPAVPSILCSSTRCRKQKRRGGSVPRAPHPGRGRGPDNRKSPERGSGTAHSGTGRLTVEFAAIRRGTCANDHFHALPPGRRVRDERHAASIRSGADRRYASRGCPGAFVYRAASGRARRRCVLSGRQLADSDSRGRRPSTRARGDRRSGGNSAGYDRGRRSGQWSGSDPAIPRAPSGRDADGHSDAGDEWPRRAHRHSDGVPGCKSDRADDLRGRCAHSPRPEGRCSGLPAQEHPPFGITANDPGRPRAGREVCRPRSRSRSPSM